MQGLSRQNGFKSDLYRRNKSLSPLGGIAPVSVWPDVAQTGRPSVSARTVPQPPFQVFVFFFFNCVIFIILLDSVVRDVARETTVPQFGVNTFLHLTQDPLSDGRGHDAAGRKRRGARAELGFSLRNIRSKSEFGDTCSQNALKIYSV